MLYTMRVTAEAGTHNTFANAAEGKVRLANGIIVKIDIEFPSGCQGLVTAAVTREGIPIWPSNYSKTVRGEGETVTGPEHYEINAEPRDITGLVINTDDTYDHTVEFRIFVLPRHVVLPWNAVIYALQRLQDAIDRFISVLRFR